MQSSSPGPAGARAAISERAPTAAGGESTGSVARRAIHLAKPDASSQFDGLLLTGPGPAILAAAAETAGTDGIAVLDDITNRLLVNKGADWTHSIQAEYLRLYRGSAGTFTLVWDTRRRQWIAHGAVFQSAAAPGTGLVCHIRTAEEWNGWGLGTMVTEEVTRAAWERGADLVCLATDDKRHRLQQGERAATGMYSKLGYALLARKELADTIDWLLVIDREIFEEQQAAKSAADGRLPAQPSAGLQARQRKLVAAIQDRFTTHLAEGQFEAVGEGDLANLFLLLNQCPPNDFRLKLGPWGIQLGPEIERSFVVNIRPAIADRDRLEDASLVWRDAHGGCVAVCAARLAAPFTRNTFDLDFSCLPQFLDTTRRRVTELIAATLTRIRESPARPRRCRIVFTGIDEAKVALLRALGFAASANRQPFFTPDGQPAFVAEEFERRMN